MQNYKKRISIKQLFMRHLIRFSLAIVAIVVIAMGGLLYKNIVDTVSDSRLVNLKQTGYSLTTIKRAVDGVSDAAMDALSGFIGDESDSEIIRDLLTDKATMDALFESTIALINRLGFDITVEIVTVDGGMYASNPDYEISLRAFISSNWYINMVYGSSEGHAERIWGIRVVDPTEKNITVLSSCRTIRGADGEVTGIMIVDVNHAVLYETYEQILKSRDNSNVQIIDENGFVISDPNQSLIGFQTYDVGYMSTKLPVNGSEIKTIAGRRYLVTTWSLSESGWTVIERTPISVLLKPLRQMLIITLLISVGALIIAALIAIGISGRITGRMSEMAVFMNAFHSEQSTEREFPILPDDPLEIDSMGRGFNTMLGNIRALIEEVRETELDRQKMEFDFLQAQINPHFLHNTLLSVKATIMLGRYDDAMQMLQAVINLMRSPIKAREPMGSLEEEIDGIRNYIKIMEYRYQAHYELSVSINPETEKLMFPRMTFQPVVENAVFHGFSEQKENMQIRIEEHSDADFICISIADNGKGMTEEQLNNIWSSEKKSKHALNNISMENVYKRFCWFFGEGADVEAYSDVGTGTVITFYIPRTSCTFEERTLKEGTER